MSKSLYNIGILLLNLAIKIAAIIGLNKAKDWVDGRKKWKESIKTIDINKESIWIHAASHGEGLMAIPLLKKFSEEYSNFNIIISFFSPSGFKNFNYSQQNLTKVYLPIDYKVNAEFILNTLRPKLLIFVKYDFWFNIINTAHQLKIPTLCFSTNINENKWFLKPFWKWQKKSLKNISSILTIDEKSRKNLIKKGFTNVSFSGDTRYDQVRLGKDKEQTIEITKPCIIIGSSWREEEECISSIIEDLDGFQIIIAPHSIYKNRINDLTLLFGDKSGLFSEIKEVIPQVLIIDNIGMLDVLYELSQIAIIGGGFSGKLHNIIEPAAKGNLILFGPNIVKFPEATEMIDEGFASTFKNSKELLIKIKEQKNSNSENSKKFILNKKGATEIVFTKCKELLNQSNTSASSRI